MTFYQTVLGGSLDLQTVDEQGAVRPAGPGDRVAHARLEADGALIVGSDGHPSYPSTVGDHMAIALTGTDKDRITKIFDDLGEGGYVKGRLTKQPWGAVVGWLADKFGITWMVSIEEA
jgi:PhnB protein